VADEIVLASGAIVRAQGAARRDGPRLASGDRVTVTVAPEDVLLLRRSR
jgi:hypothetical protein